MNRILEEEAMSDVEECRAYQALVRKHSDFMDKPFAKKVLGLCPVGARVMDIGSGPGLIPILMVASRPDLKVTGTDISPAMIDLARKEARRRGIDDQVDFQEADAKSLPFNDASFDVVICHSVLHHFSDPVPALNEMHRVLRPSGYLLLKDLIRPPAWLIPICVTVIGGLMGYNRREKRIYDESLRAALNRTELKDALDESRLQGRFRYNRSTTHHLMVEVRKSARPLREQRVFRAVSTGDSGIISATYSVAS